MGGLRRRIDPGLLIALALALVAAMPFMTRPGLPRQTDAELHVYRAAELGRALRGGVLYPRWAPNLYLGYGYPIFNYYAPLTYHLASWFDLLPGVDVVRGVKAVFVLGLISAALGAYLLGRELYGPAAGALAAACYVFAPYVVFVDPHARGVLAEHFAICMLPLAFYAYHRLLSGMGGRRAFVGSVLALAAIVFSHNLLGLVATCLLSAYWVWATAVGWGRNRAGWGALAFAVAAALIAFFWLPGWLERDAVKLEVIGPGYFDFHEHFLSLRELLAPSRVMDLGATAPRYRFNLGVAQWLLALPAAIVCVWPAGRRRAQLHLYFLVAALGLICLMVPASAVVWEHIRGMPYLQFPWRLLGPTNLMLAMCAAAGASLLPQAPWRVPAVVAGLAAVLLLALPVLYPPMWSPDFGGTDPEDIIEWEQQGLALGTTSTGDFVPAGAALVPMHVEPGLLESHRGPGPVDKVNRAVLPAGATVQIVEHGPAHDLFDIVTPRPFVFRLYTFYFPGWRAYVDGEEAEIMVAGPEGFITLNVPERRHQVLVRLEDTAPRRMGWGIAAAGLVGLVVVAALMPGSRGAGQLPKGMSVRSAIWFGGVVLGFLLLKSGVIDPHDDWLRYTSPPGTAWAAQAVNRASFAGQIELLGHDVSAYRVRPGDTLVVTLYWRALVPLSVNYQSFLHLAQPIDRVWGQDDHLNPGYLPTTRWPLDKYVWDEYEIEIPLGTPPGTYLLNAGLYSAEGGYRLQRLDEHGQPIGDGEIVTSIEVALQ